MQQVTKYSNLDVESPMSVSQERIRKSDNNITQNLARVNYEPSDEEVLED